MPLCYSNGYPYHISCYSMRLCIYADMFRISIPILICCHVVSLCPYLDVVPWLYTHMSFISTHSISLILTMPICQYDAWPVYGYAYMWLCIHVLLVSSSDDPLCLGMFLCQYASVFVCMYIFHVLYILHWLVCGCMSMA